MKINRILYCFTAITVLFLSACSEAAYSVDAGIFTYDVILNQQSYARGDTLVAKVAMKCGVECNGTLKSPDSIPSHVIRAYIKCNGERIADCQYVGEICDGKETSFRIRPGDKLETTVSWKLSDDYELYADDKLILVLDTEMYIGEIRIHLTGYPNRKPIILTQDDMFSEFHLHFDGCWNIYQHYDIEPYGDNWRLKYEISKGGGPDNQEVIADCIVTDATLKKVSAALAEYNVGKWNFYDETNKYVLDGGGFSLNVVYPGFSIRAKGWNESPEGLYDLEDEIKAIFEEFTGKVDF